MTCLAKPALSSNVPGFETWAQASLHDATERQGADWDPPRPDDKEIR